MGINVLSLFDGISCGQIALDQVGIEVDNYFSSEIDKYAITVAQHNFPNTIQLGDVSNIRGKDLPKIDLLIGGSPCQGFSTAGKGLNFDDPRSKLFFEFVRLRQEVQPTYFLLENVVMISKWQNIISKYLGRTPIQINSRLVSAQNRERLYWTDIPILTLPADTHASYHKITGGYPAAMRGRRINPETGKRSDYDMSIPIEQYIEFRTDDKSNCLTTVDKDNVVVQERMPFRVPAKDWGYRFLAVREYEQLQTIPTGYTDVVSNNQRKRLIGNAWTVDVISHLLKGLRDGKFIGSGDKVFRQLMFNFWGDIDHHMDFG